MPAELRFKPCSKQTQTPYASPPKLATPKPKINAASYNYHFESVLKASECPKKSNALQRSSLEYSIREVLSALRIWLKNAQEHSRAIKLRTNMMDFNKLLERCYMLIRKMDRFDEGLFALCRKMMDEIKMGDHDDECHLKVLQMAAAEMALLSKSFDAEVELAKQRQFGVEYHHWLCYLEKKVDQGSIETDLMAESPEEVVVKENAKRSARSKELKLYPSSSAQHLELEGLRGHHGLSYQPPRLCVGETDSKEHLDSSPYCYPPPFNSSSFNFEFTFHSSKDEEQTSAGPYALYLQPLPPVDQTPAFLSSLSKSTSLLQQSRAMAASRPRTNVPRNPRAMRDTRLRFTRAERIQDFTTAFTKSTRAAQSTTTTRSASEYALTELLAALRKEHTIFSRRMEAFLDSPTAAQATVLRQEALDNISRFGPLTSKISENRDRIREEIRREQHSEMSHIVFLDTIFVRIKRYVDGYRGSVASLDAFQTNCERDVEYKQHIEKAFGANAEDGSATGSGDVAMDEGTSTSFPTEEDTYENSSWSQSRSQSSTRSPSPMANSPVI
ncbi:hypothetical protein HDU97_005462 [Phlyctochytrium planicorne]|nr:hypothetical protein HDU97_005462 [Phlyctochytrium planicorne]